MISLSTVLARVLDCSLLGDARQLVDEDVMETTGPRGAAAVTEPVLVG